MDHIRTSYGYDVNGNPIYLVGHIRYIVNDNGYTLDKILEDMAYVSDIEYIHGRQNFPVIGNKDHLYIDTQKGLLYFWDEETAVYSSILAVDKDLVDSKHIHDNMTILNDIKYALTEELKQHYDTAYTHSQANHAPVDAEKNVNADWNAENGDAHILNKPPLGTIACRDADEFATAEQGSKADNAVQSVFVGDIEQKKLGNSIRIAPHQGAVTSVLDVNLEINKVVTSDQDGKLIASTIDSEELKQLAGVKNNIQTQIDTVTTNLKSEVDRATATDNQLLSNMNKEITRAMSKELELETSIVEEVTRATEAENSISEIIDTNKPIWDDKYSRNEIDNKFSTLETATDWKESVDTYDDITTAYPLPDDGWTVNVKDTNITYRYNGTEWIAISANAIPLATQELDGLLSHIDKSNYDDANIKKHSHSNKDILDQITQDIIDSAVTNIQSDWEVVETASPAYIKNKPTKLSDFDNDSNFATRDEVTEIGLHTHTNKEVLDQITQALLDKLNRTNRVTTITLASSKWVGTQAPYTQIVDVSGITEDDTPIITGYIEPGTSSSVSNAENIACSYLTGGTTGNGTISFYCNDKKPSVDFKVKVIGIGL